MALFLPGRGSLDTKGFRQSCPSSRRTPCRRGRRRDEEVSLRNNISCQKINGTYLNITYLKVTQNSFPCNRIVTWRHYLCTRKGGMVVWSFGCLVVWLFSCMSSQMRKLSTKQQNNKTTKQPNNKTTKPQRKPVFFDLVEEHPSKRKE